MPTPVSTTIQSYSQGWLGEFSADPTLDPFGNPLTAGAEYYNTVQATIRVYNGTGWANYTANPSISAANYASQAANYAQEAAGSATSAATSASSAATSASSVGTQATQAAASAAAAASSATAAAGSATNAAASAGSATTSANTASTAATTATNAENASNTSATNAATSATNAANSASTAAVSQTAAAASASTASGAATTAQGYAASASTAANVANTYATNAQTSANAAAASATSAAQSAAVFNGIITIPLSGTNITLSGTQFSNGIILFTGTLTTNIIVTVPATVHTFIAGNNTSGSFSLTIAMIGGSSTVQVTQSKSNSLYCDGATGIYATSSVAGFQFSGVNNISVTGTSMTSSYAGTRTVLSTGSMTTSLPLGSTFQAGGAIYVDNITNSAQTIQVSGSDALDVGSPFTMQPNDKILFSWDGTEWRTALYSNYISPSFKSKLTVQAGTASITDSGNTNAQLTLTNVGANGANLALIGNGGSTPNKFLRANSGLFQILNSAYTSVILGLDDSGDLTTAGNLAVNGTGTSTIAGSLTVSGTGASSFGGNLTVNGATLTTNAITGTIITASTSVKFQDGTTQTTANGTTAPVSTVYTPAGGTTSITTGGYTPGFIQVYQNGARLVPGQDFTATDSVHVVLGTASVTGDTFEILTAVIYSPQTAMTPSDIVYTPASGVTTFTVSTYTVGFIDVFLNGSKLVGGQDYTATTGNSVTLTTAANGTDQYDVKIWSTYTPANALQLTGGTMTGQLVAASSGIQFNNGTVVATSQPGKNWIINGSFEIAQRGFSFSNSTNSTNAYGIDRWQFYRTGFATNIVQTQNTSTVVGQHYCTIIQRTPGDTSTAPLFLSQTIETGDVRKLAGQQMTLSYYYFGGGAAIGANLSATIAYGTGTDGNLASGLTGQASINSNVTVMASPWQFATLTFTMPSNATQFGIAFSWTPTGTAGSSDFFAITGVQLELGPIATSYEQLPFREQLLRCQRYYCSTYPYATYPGTASTDSSSLYFWTGPTADAGSYGGPLYSFPTIMRIAPNTTVYNPHTGATGTAYAQNAAASLSAGVGDASTGFVFLSLANQSVAAHDFIKFHATFMAEM